ncbi:MAG: Ig-like domain-containing protein [Anaerolineaceae bacterium]
MVDNENLLYAYGRNLPGIDAAVVVLNRSVSTQQVTLDVAGYIPFGTSFTDVLSTSTYTITPTGMLESVSVPANGSAVLVATTPIAPLPVGVIDLAVDYATATTVGLSWTATTGADTYLVYRSNLSGGGHSFMGETNTNNYTDTGLTPGQRVYYLVYAKSTTTGLVSSVSNEVSAMPAYTIDWANLQWPYTITHTIGITPTENIYGQVTIDGVTSLPGATPTLIAQVGFGPDGSLPEGNAAWVWSDAVFNAQSGSNDEFVGNLLPEQIGIYHYAFRYTTTAGESWYYADKDGGTYTLDQAGNLTVVASADSTAPSAPVLSIADWGASFIDLAWTPSADDVAVYAYDIYRSTDNVNFEKIGRVVEPEITYHDDNVVTNQLYYYYVIALDTSFNWSVASNTVNHTAEPKMVSVTFDVIVPAFTPPTVYLTRTINPDGTVGDWNPAATALTPASDTLWTGTFDILDGTIMDFKFTRGTWETVMKGVDGNEELGNLSLTVDYGLDGTQTYASTVLNWRDPIVVSTMPVDGAVDVPQNAAVVVTWSQAMSDGACPAVWVVPDSTDLVAVTCSFNTITNQMTITPTGGFPPLSEITVGLSGLIDFGGDVQQVLFPLSFSTINLAPMAAADTYTTIEDTVLMVTAPGVLTNDTDAEALTAVLVDDVSNGSLVLAEDGSFTYTPDLNFNGEDSYTYKAFDGDLYSDVVTVTITVTPVNDAPTAVGDEYTVVENGLLEVAAPGVMENDLEVDTDERIVVLVSNVSNGRLVLYGDGSFTYQPKPDFFGTDTFVYKLITYPATIQVDGWTDEATGTITVTEYIPPVFFNYLPMIFN